MPQFGHDGGREESKYNIVVCKIEVAIISAQKRHTATFEISTQSADEPGCGGDFGAIEMAVGKTRGEIKRHTSEAAAEIDKTEYLLARQERHDGLPSFVVG